LLAALDRVAVVADQKNSVVKFGFNCDNQLLKISAEAQDVGSGQETLAVADLNGSLEIAFNVRYLMDGLKAIATPKVQFCLNTATAPVVLKPVNGEQDSTYLVMPVQVRQ
jgi:DNA polymerase-3 subunit beta